MKYSGRLINRFLIASFLLLCLQSSNTFAQDSNAFTPDPSLESVYAKLKSGKKNPALDSIASKAELEYHKSLIADQEYYRQSLTHRRSTFEWQYNSGIIIFWLVILTVICGLVYSGMQFYYSIQEIRLKKEIWLEHRANQNVAPDVPVLQNSNTEVEISLNSVKVSSSLIGVIILIISVGFFFLYLTFVYPIDQMRIDLGKPKLEQLTK